MFELLNDVKRCRGINSLNLSLLEQINLTFNVTRSADLLAIFQVSDMLKFVSGMLSDIVKC